MRRFFPGFLALVFVPFLWAGPEVKVDKASVTVEKRGAKDWCVLDSQASVEAAVSVETLVKVISDYDSYPKLFSKIREAKAEAVPGAVLVAEKVVVSALGVENVNRFTIRVVRTDLTSPYPTVRFDWTQERTDGSIDDVEGWWVLEDRGTPKAPLTRISYRTKSAVPVVVPGQDAFVRMFLGGETRAVVEIVVKKALFL